MIHNYLIQLRTCVDRLVSRTLFACALRCVSDSSSLTGGTNDLEVINKEGINNTRIQNIFDSVN